MVSIDLFNFLGSILIFIIFVVATIFTGSFLDGVFGGLVILTGWVYYLLYLEWVGILQKMDPDFYGEKC